MRLLTCFIKYNDDDNDNDNDVRILFKVRPYESKCKYVFTYQNKDFLYNPDYKHRRLILRFQNTHHLHLRHSEN